MQVKSLLGFTVWSLTAQTERRPLGSTTSLQPSVFQEPTEEERWSERGLILQSWEIKAWLDDSPDSEEVLQNERTLIQRSTAQSSLQRIFFRIEAGNRMGFYSLVVFCLSTRRQQNNEASRKLSEKLLSLWATRTRTDGRTDGRAERLTARVISYCC